MLGGNQETNMPLLICPVCKTEFYRKPANIRNAKTNCCSVSCSVKITKNRKGTAKLTTTKCETCGKYFEHRINEKRKFCNSICEKFRKDKNSGRSQKILTSLFEQQLNETADIEKRFPDLRNKKKLSVDAVFLKNKIALEFNGIHHYEENYYHNDSLKDQIFRDNMKIRYLLKNGYNVVEWPYYTSLSKANVKEVISFIANQQPSSSTYVIAIDEKVQRLDDEVVRPINHPRASDILKIRDEDIVRTYGMTNHKS